MMGPLLAAALACVAPRDAGPRATFYDDAAPPLRYRGGPASVRLVIATPAETDAACRGPSPPTCGYVVEACTLGQRTGAEVHLPDPCTFSGERWATLACHELGHVHGWPADHPR